MPLSQCRYDATVFDGFFSTRPAVEIEGATWGEFVANVAPMDAPVAVAEKNSVLYVVPCILKVAPLVAGTLQKAIAEGWPTTGKMRSAVHMTEAATLKYDLDGMTEQQWSAVQEKLKASGLTFLVYSTHSHGHEDKPGYRVRVWVPMDKALAQADYALAWEGAASILFEALPAGILDGSSRLIHQQQGIYATTRERAGLAFRSNHRAGVASADALVALGRKVVPPRTLKPANARQITPGTFGSVERSKITAALGMLDPNNYETWIKVCACLVALRGCLGGDGLRWWLEFSERADEASKAKNNVSGTDPEIMFERMTPTMSVDAAMGTLMARAKSAAMATAETDLMAGALTARGFEAVRYLAAAKHKTALDALLNKYEVAT
jgi:hypothetical protein